MGTKWICTHFVRRLKSVTIPLFLLTFTPKRWVENWLASFPGPPWFVIFSLHTQQCKASFMYYVLSWIQTQEQKPRNEAGNLMEKFRCFCAWNTLNIQFTAKLKYSVTCTHTHHTYTHTYYTYTHIPHLYPPTPTHTIHTAPSSGGCLHQSRPRRSSRHPTGFRSSPAHA